MKDDIPPPPTGVGEGRSYFWVVIVAAVLVALLIAVISNRGGPRDERMVAVDAGQVAPVPDAGPATADAGEPAVKKESVKPRDVPGKEITAEQVRAVVKKHQRELSSCYRGPQGKLLARKVELAVIVEPNGSISSSSLVGRISGAQNAIQCINVHVRHWRFPAPGGTMSQKIVVPLIGIQGR